VVAVSSVSREWKDIPTVRSEIRSAGEDDANKESAEGVFTVDIMLIAKSSQDGHKAELSGKRIS
jgi:hypothetical protein